MSTPNFALSRCHLCQEQIVKIYCRFVGDYVTQCVLVEKGFIFHDGGLFKILSPNELPSKCSICFKCLEQFELKPFTCSCDICGKLYKLDTTHPDVFNILGWMRDEQGYVPDKSGNMVPVQVIVDPDTDKTSLIRVHADGTITQVNIGEDVEIDQTVIDNESTNEPVHNDVLSDAMLSDDDVFVIPIDKTNSSEPTAKPKTWLDWLEEQSGHKYIRPKTPERPPSHSIGEDALNIMRKRGTGDRCNSFVIEDGIYTDSNVWFTNSRPEYLPLYSLICDGCIGELIKTGVCEVRNDKNSDKKLECVCKICRMGL